MPEDKFIKIYVDILVAQDTTGDKSITKDSLKTIVLQKYEVKDSIYSKTIDYYNTNPEKWEKFFDRAIKEVEKLKVSEEK